MGRQKTSDDFPAEKFRGCCGHIRSGNVAECGVAIRTLMQMCEEHGLNFAEGCQVSYASPPDEAIADLQAQIEQLATDKAQLQEGILALNEEMQNGAKPKGAGFVGLLTAAWSLAPFRLVLLALLVASRMAFFVFIENAGYVAKNENIGGTTWSCNAAFILLFCLVFCGWSGRQYEQTGIGSVVMRSIIFVVLSSGAVACLFGFKEWHEWFSSPMASSHYQIGAFIFVLIATLLCASNFADCLCEKAETSDGRLFGFLREWFLNGRSA